MSEHFQQKFNHTKNLIISTSPHGLYTDIPGVIEEKGHNVEKNYDKGIENVAPWDQQSQPLITFGQAHLNNMADTTENLGRSINVTFEVDIENSRNTPPNPHVLLKDVESGTVTR